MTKYPEGFPLKPYDQSGRLIKVGDHVKVLLIPAWLVNDLDEESSISVKSCEGEEMVISEIDDYGYAWLEKVTLSTDEAYESNSFSMEPKNLLKVERIKA